MLMACLPNLIAETMGNARHVSRQLRPVVFRHPRKRCETRGRQNRIPGGAIFSFVRARRADSERICSDDGRLPRCIDGRKAWEPLHRLLDNLDKRRIEILSKRAAEARDIVYRATGNDEIRRQAVAAYRQLEAEYGPNVAVAVRSSATAEDLPSASFAGQHESFLNVRGGEGVSRPAAGALPRFSRIARYRTASTTGSITSKSRSRSA